MDLRQQLTELRDPRYTGIEILGARLNFCVDKDPAGGFTVHLRWVTSGDGQQAEQSLGMLQATTPHFTGQRWWFSCPRCGRRCRILYRMPYAARFACRLCLGLRYRSQQRSRDERHIWQIRARMYEM